MVGDEVPDVIGAVRFPVRKGREVVATFGSWPPEYAARCKQVRVARAVVGVAIEPVGIARHQLLNIQIVLGRERGNLNRSRASLLCAHGHGEKRPTDDSDGNDNEYMLFQYPKLTFAWWMSVSNSYGFDFHAPAEQAAVDLRVQRLHAPVQHFRETRVRRDFGDGNAFLFEQLGSAPGGKDLHLQRGERLAKLHHARLVGDAEERPPDFHPATFTP